MRKVRAFGVRLLSLFRARRSEDDFAAELESHVALHIDEGIRAGLTPEEARRQALIRLGGLGANSAGASRTTHSSVA